MCKSTISSNGFQTFTPQKRHYARFNTINIDSIRASEYTENYYAMTPCKLASGLRFKINNFLTIPVIERPSGRCNTVNRLKLQSTQ